MGAIYKDKTTIDFKASGLITKLSVHEIEGLLLAQFGGIRGKNICIPNLSWGMFKYEMDFAVVTPQRTFIEVEIKRSWSDFIADFKKNHIHDDPHVKKFYYCVPEAMAKKASEWCHDTNIGIILYYEHHSVFMYREAGIRKGYLRIDDDTLFKLSRLAVIRYWTHRDDEVGNEKPIEDKRRITVYIRSLLYYYEHKEKNITFLETINGYKPSRIEVIEFLKWCLQSGYKELSDAPEWNEYLKLIKYHEQ